MAFDRSAFHRGLQQSTQSNIDRAGDTGGFHSYVKRGKRPRFTKIPEGQIVFDIIPFVVDRDFNQYFKKGSTNYMIDVWVHQNVGVNNDQVVCLAKNFGQPCPICEEKARRESQGATYDEVKVFKPKRRCIYNIWIHDQSRAEENKGVQILEIAHFSMESELQKIVVNPVTRQYTYFADPDTGKSVCFTRTGTGMQNTRYSGYQFIDRTGPIPDSILEQAEDPTSLIDIPTYEEVYAKFHAVPPASAQQHEDTPSAPQSYNTPVNANVYGSESQMGGQAPAPWDTPAGNGFAPAYNAPTPQAAQPQQSEPQCPVAAYGGIFGQTVDKFPQCAGCDVWDACADKHDRG